ncbi:hypothetical protein E4U34_002893 [Claviceps purpurea]|nr:hypothetical protein E4U34_002893 [Claviceps purpurea]
MAHAVGANGTTKDYLAANSTIMTGILEERDVGKVMKDVMRDDLHLTFWHAISKTLEKACDRPYR